jgi:hypothetical protein
MFLSQWPGRQGDVGLLRECQGGHLVGLAPAPGRLRPQGVQLIVSAFPIPAVVALRTAQIIYPSRWHHGRVRSEAHSVPGGYARTRRDECGAGAATDHASPELEAMARGFNDVPGRSRARNG